jgi:hypothetical protein
MARHMSDTQPSVLNPQLLCPAFWILGEIIGDPIPRCAICDESMKLWPNSGIIIERAHSNRHLWAVRPIATEQTRTAIRTEGLYCAFAFSIDLDQLRAFTQTKLLSQHTRLSANRRSGMLAATFAMAMARLNEGRIDFKPHAATQATSADGVAHARINSQPSIIQSSTAAAVRVVPAKNSQPLH